MTWEMQQLENMSYSVFRSTEILVSILINQIHPMPNFKTNVERFCPAAYKIQKALLNISSVKYIDFILASFLWYCASFSSLSFNFDRAHTVLLILVFQPTVGYIGLETLVHFNFDRKKIFPTNAEVSFYLSPANVCILNSIQRFWWFIIG